MQDASKACLNILQTLQQTYCSGPCNSVGVDIISVPLHALLASYSCVCGNCARIAAAYSNHTSISVLFLVLAGTFCSYTQSTELDILGKLLYILDVHNKPHPLKIFKLSSTSFSRLWPLTPLNTHPYGINPIHTQVNIDTNTYIDCNKLPMMSATYIQCSTCTAIVERYNTNPVNDYIWPMWLWDARAINIDTLLLWWTCGLLVVFLFMFNGSVHSFLSQLYWLYEGSEWTGNIPHLLQSRWTRTDTY